MNISTLKRTHFVLPLRRCVYNINIMCGEGVTRLVLNSHKYGQFLGYKTTFLFCLIKFQMGSYHNSYVNLFANIVRSCSSAFNATNISIGNVYMTSRFFASAAKWNLSILSCRNTTVCKDLKRPPKP